MEDILTFSLFGLTGSWYGAFVALGALVALLFFARYCRAEGLKPGTAAVFAALAIPLGLVCSRLVFCLLDNNFHMLFSLRAALMIWGGGYSMTGALLGAALAAYLTARIQHIRPMAVLDVMAAAIFFFILAERVGEGFITERLGRSRPLTDSWLASSFLAETDGYGTYFLRTYILEAVTAAVLAICMARRITKHGAKGCLLLAMLLLGCTQTLWESMRADSHIKYGFISLQQILYALMFAVPLVYYAAKNGKKAVILSLAVCVVLVGAIVGLEFMIDRSEISDVILYIPYTLLLVVPAVLGLHYRKRSGLK